MMARKNKYREMEKVMLVMKVEEEEEESRS